LDALFSKSNFLGGKKANIPQTKQKREQELKKVAREGVEGDQNNKLIIP
jgi:hypothetical protein